MKCMVACLLSLSRCSQAVEYTSEALADRIDTSKLPGAESLSVNFNQFSGYLNGICITFLYSELCVPNFVLQWTLESTFIIGLLSRRMTQPLILWPFGRTAVLAALV